MELIPILSFIILVATISTFILAIGAYVLYKVRERKGRLQVSAHAAQQMQEAELYMPQARAAEYQQASASQERMYQQAQGRGVSAEMNAGAQPYYPAQRGPEPKYTNAQQPGRQQSFQQQGYAQQQRQPNVPYFPEEEGGADERKFMKYTSEGYVPVNENKNGNNLKWR